MPENTFTVEKFKELYSLIKKEDADQTFKGLDYISWSTAWKYLMLSDANASYEIIEKSDGGIVWEEYGTFLVKTSVNAFGKTIKMHLPIMDNNHNAVKLEAYEIKTKAGTQFIPALNSRILNDAVMRCLAKNIAMFGIGLPLYVKEDLPSEEKAEKERVSREDVLICTVCGKEIKGTKTLSAKQIADGTKEAYGATMCADCGRKAKKEKEGPEKSEPTE